MATTRVAVAPMKAAQIMTRGCAPPYAPVSIIPWYRFVMEVSTRAPSISQKHVGPHSPRAFSHARS